MKQINFIAILFLGLLFQSCSTTNNETFWVSGMKTECSAGAGKMQCLNISKGENLDKAKWENFYSSIEGFQFEEGYLKKLEVKTEKIDNPPADGSSIRYILVKELEKKVDYRVKTRGKWVLNKLNGHPVDRSTALPEMEIILNQMKVGGTGGCNSYTGDIAILTNNILNFGNIVSTQRACINKNIEGSYFKALNTVNTFQVKEDNLILYDKDGDIVLSFLAKKEGEVNRRIHDLWTAVRIDGNPINRMSETPRMEINLTEMKVFGNDGCNEYTGAIVEISDIHIEFGPLASTKKMCRKMDTPDSYNKAMNSANSYKLDGLNLILLDKKGEEVLAFLKAD